jgi:flap endonuclease-1
MGLQIGEIVPKSEIKLEDLSGKIIAVDAFNVLYQFLTTIRQPDGMPLTDKKGRITSHLSGLFYRTTNLMGKGLKLAFVFDGEAPELKHGTHEIRDEAKRSAREKYESFRASGEFEEASKYAGRFVTLNEEMIEESKRLLSALGLPVIQAPGEGEAQAAFMAKRGDAFASASQDYDSLLFQCPKLVRNMTLATRRKLASGAYVSIEPEFIDLQKVLNTLQLNQDQLICLGILIGTDYNPKGVRGIGPKTALKIVKQQRQPLVIFSNVRKEYEFDFDWSEIFELFKKPDVTSDYNLKFKPIDRDELIKLLVKEHDFSEDRINSTLEKLEKHSEENKQRDLKKWF